MGRSLGPLAGDQSAPLFCFADQLEPSKWSNVPSRPAAQTSFEEVPASARSALSVPEAAANQAEPFQWSNVPASPATQTSVAEEPQMAENVTGFGIPATTHHSAPHEGAGANTAAGAELTGGAPAAAAGWGSADSGGGPHAINTRASVNAVNAITARGERTDQSRLLAMLDIVEQDPQARVKILHRRLRSRAANDPLIAWPLVIVSAVRTPSPACEPRRSW